MKPYRFTPIVLALAACARTAAQPAPASDAVPVRVAPVVREAVTVPVVASGIFGAKEDIQLGFKVGGVIARVLVDPGQPVRAGQLLAELQQEEIAAAVSRAQAAADDADRQLLRARRLYADSVVTLAQLQGRETAARVARADLAVARFNRAHSRIVAPADGIVLRRNYQPGELVSAGAPVLTVASRARGDVFRVGLADRDVVRVQVGDSATVRFDALPGRTFSGTVTQVGAAAEPGVGTYLVDIRLRHAGGLVSDLIGTAKIYTPASGTADVIPVEALVEADGTRGVVYTLTDEHTAERHEVTVGPLTGKRIAVLRGLVGDSLVITQGAAYVRDGGAVRVIP